MKDTEIVVAGKCVGEYDMCKDLPVIFMDFTTDVTKTSGNNAHNVYTIKVDPKKLNECYKRNMRLHILFSAFGNGIQNNSRFELVFPFFGEMKHNAISGNYVYVSMRIAAPSTVIDGMPEFSGAIPGEKFSSGNISFDDGFGFTIRSVDAVTTLEFLKVYASIY